MGEKTSASPKRTESVRELSERKLSKGRRLHPLIKAGEVTKAEREEEETGGNLPVMTDPQTDVVDLKVVMTSIAQTIVLTQVGVTLVGETGTGKDSEIVTGGMAIETETRVDKIEMGKETKTGGTETRKGTDVEKKTGRREFGIFPCDVSSEQDRICMLGKAHMRSTPCLRSVPSVAFETVAVSI